MTGWRKRQVVDMALEAGLAFDSEEFPEIWQTYMNVGREEIEAFAELVRADEREKFLAALRQLHDSYSLASDPNGLKERGQKRPQNCGTGYCSCVECVMEPKQEPAAWMVYTQDGQSVYVTDNPIDIQENQRALPMYTTPPQRTWVGLSDEEVDDLSREMVKGKKSVNWLSYSIEAKLKELNAP